VAAKKTAGVLGDDLALNAQQVAGVNADRELPVVWAVAKGSLLNKAILVPAAKIVKGYPNQMPSYQGQLSDKELSSIIAYIQSLSANAPAPAAAPADGQPTDVKPADPAATPPAPAAAPAK
jgi:hypothetical protein